MYDLGSLGINISIEIPCWADVSKNPGTQLLLRLESATGIREPLRLTRCTGAIAFKQVMQQYDTSEPGTRQN